MLQAMAYNTKKETIEDGSWLTLNYIPTKVVGENVSEHSDRIYVEVLSKFY